MLLPIWCFRPLLRLPLAIDEMLPLANIAGAACSAVAGATSSAVIIEVASSTNPVGFVDPSRTFVVNCENDSWNPDGCLEDCGDLVEVASLEEQ